MPLTLARVLVVVSSGGVKVVLTEHPGSVLGARWQLPSEALTTLVITLAGVTFRGLTTVTVKWTVALPAPPAVVAAGTFTFWVHSVPSAEGVPGAATHGVQPSPTPAYAVFAGTLSVRV